MSPLRPIVTRYRLRFLLQEIDLPQGETLIGRSATCHVTIDDPLVSRQHARIRINGEHAVIEDLGSRNGVVVNGSRVNGRQPLADNDRLRIGTQELVFCVVPELSRSNGRFGNRPTGFMCHCAACGLPYPTELVECPSCGSRERSDDDTISGFTGDDAHRNWTLELIIEVLRKAVELRRWEDVERMLRRTRVNVEEQLAATQTLDPAQLAVLGQAAAQVARFRGDAEWARWLLELHRAVIRLPEPAVCDILVGLPDAQLRLLAEPAERLIQDVLKRGGPDPEQQLSWLRIQSLRSAGRGE